MNARRTALVLLHLLLAAAAAALILGTTLLAGRRAGTRIEILNGLSGDERIAGSNAFLLKAELAKGEAEHGH